MEAGRGVRVLPARAGGTPQGPLQTREFLMRPSSLTSQACKLFTSSIGMEPKFPLVYEERALARLHLKDKAGALADFKACLVVVGNSGDELDTRPRPQGCVSSPYIPQIHPTAR